MISLIHPSRSRPYQAYLTAQKWIEKAGCDIEYILSIDEDEPVETRLKYSIGVMHRANCKFIVNPNRSAVDAINNAAKIATGDILVQMADDFDCPDNWVELIEMETRGRHDFVLRVEDGIQSWLCTLPILDRAYYNRFGYIYHPDYRHMFVDTDFTHVAFGLGRVIRSNLLFRHLHYSVKGLGVLPDEINHRADRTTTEGRNTYLNRFSRGFDIPGFDVWNFKDRDHEIWLKNHGHKRPL